MMGLGVLLTGVLVATPVPPGAGDRACEVVCEPEPVTGPFGALRVGFSAWRASMEVQAQAGWAFRRLQAGLVVEHAPFIDLGRPDISAGAFGFGAFLAYRAALTRRVALRFELIAGGSVLLFDTYGYHAGDVGLWVGAKVMGLEVALGRHLALLVDVVDLSLPAYHLATMPFIYPQWRWSLGLAFR